MTWLALYLTVGTILATIAAASSIDDLKNDPPMLSILVFAVIVFAWPVVISAGLLGLIDRRDE